MAKEKRIMMSFDTINQGKETEASKAGKTKKGDTKSNPPKGKIVKETGKKQNKMPITKSKEVDVEKKKPTFVKGGKTVKKK